MGIAMSSLAGTRAQLPACRLVIRKEKGLAEVLQFVMSGLEVGQQVVVMGGPTCLKDLARSLGEHGLRPDSLLHNGRLVFLTAPNYISQLSKLGDPLRQGPLRPNGAIMRWVSDWSWAYANNPDPIRVLDLQQRVHEFIRSYTAHSLCTVHCEKLGRSSLLALLADHRRAARAPSRAA